MRTPTSSLMATSDRAGRGASWKNCFERGHVDEFALGSVELGDLRSVRVGHDGDQSYRRRNGCANVCIRITAKGGG